MEPLAIAGWTVAGFAVFALVCIWNIKVQQAKVRRRAKISKEEQERLRQAEKPRADTGWDVAVLH
jgi:hypothetical protein